MMELLNAYDHASDEMKASARPILWSMDEAGRIGIPNLPEHASTVVGRKISLSLSAQSRSQFHAIYGHDRTKNLFNNIRTQLIFCQADFDTAQHYSDRMGDTSGYAHSESEYGDAHQHGEIRTGNPRHESTGFYAHGQRGTRLFFAGA
jgi:type IV secretory pathway TraG/TraD family ATPase VirD4